MPGKPKYSATIREVPVERLVWSPHRKAEATGVWYPRRASAAATDTQTGGKAGGSTPLPSVDLRLEGAASLWRVIITLHCSFLDHPSQTQSVSHGGFQSHQADRGDQRSHITLHDFEGLSLCFPFASLHWVRGPLHRYHLITSAATEIQRMPQILSSWGRVCNS